MNDISLTRPLSGKVTVVTGAGRSIGRSVAYAQAGAAVVCSARNKNELRETAALIETAGN